MVILTVQQIAELCYNKFRDLPKTGKPTNSQWTVLAGIVQYDRRSQTSKVVSLATGTKCIGRSRLCKNGFVLNDSHAEVLARRGFLRYLYHELLEAATRNQQDKEDAIFSWDPESGCFVLNKHLDFHFLSTQTPCGDACIQEEADESLPKRQRLCQDEHEDASEAGLPLISSNAVYTGAKLINRNDMSLDDMLQTPMALCAH
ncbi:tRNA-specific adenosine deaminase 1 [Drosophila innubila]|uniref:tRNA-specific adenosine deaminase 1 n=1 Tax=Drosophila innubila TaxID=198719 RepID=UPI00148C9E82|nr:tRNA-specific adenosine deaminase 1 [Drosophila innubila]